MDAIEKVAMGLVGLAVVVAIVSAKNSPAVTQDVFTGSSQLFASILQPVGGSPAQATSFQYASGV